MTKIFKYKYFFILILLMAVIFVGCGNENSNMITIKGSDTMLPIVRAWAETFMKANPEMLISVVGGGSGTGLDALINRRTDLATSSRDILVEEVEMAISNGLDILQTPVALDAIAVVVNSANPVSELTIAQIKGIFTGEITNWSEVGGTDDDIVILSREPNSGTFVFFQQVVLQKQNYAVSSQLMPSSSSIVQAVSDGETAIGYVGLGYATNAGVSVKTLLIKNREASKAVMPSGKSIMDASYPIARPLYLFVDGEPTGAVRAFTEYILSDAGQQVVMEIGYVPITGPELVQ